MVHFGWPHAGSAVLMRVNFFCFPSCLREPSEKKENPNEEEEIRRNPTEGKDGRRAG